MSILGDDFDRTVKKFEGWAPRASWDYKQHTNGWGTRARYPGEVVSPEEAQRRYDEEIGRAHSAVTSFAPNLDAGTTKALTDLTFNAGTKWQSAGLGEAIRQGDFDRARHLYTQYVNAGGQPLPGLVNRRQAMAPLIGGGEQSPGPSGQQTMRNPWNGLYWPTDSSGTAQTGELNPGMTPGSLLATRLGALGMFDQVLPDGMAVAQQPPPDTGRGVVAGNVAGNVPRETPSESKPSLLDTILQRAQNPGFQSGMMMFLDAARGGSGIDGYKAGMSGAASMQETLMKDAALRQKLAQEKALKELLAKGEGMESVPRPVRDITAITGNPAPIVSMLARDPLETQHKRLQNEVLQRNLNAPPDDGSKLIEVNGSIVRVGRDGTATPVYGSDPTTQRRKQLIDAKIDPETATSKIFIATGKMPREDQQPLTAGDKKAILEADSNVMATQNVLTLLKEAEDLNPKTNTGWTAGIRASIGNNLPDWLVPDFISSPESSRATTNFENLTIGQALTQLKPIFGAAPTEGERKILMDLQGSVNQPVEVRKDILRRAKMLAEKRLQEQQGIADGLRGGTFYKQGGAKPPTAAGVPAATAAPAPAAVLSEARAAIQRGAPREAVLQRLRENGIDPAGL